MGNNQEPLHRKVEELEEKCGRLEKSLQESEERFHKIFHASSDLIAISAIKDGRIVDLNQTIAALLGFKREELIGTTAAEHNLWVDPKQRDTVVQKLQEEKRVRDMNVRLRSKTGDILQVLFSADPITIDEKPCLISVCVDITNKETGAEERKQTEISLRESEERFRLIAETVDEIFWLYDAEKHVATYLNSAFDRIWGFPKERTLDNPDYFLDAIHPEDRKQVSLGIELIHEGKPFDYEYRIIRPDGTIRHLWSRGYPIAEKSGRPKRYVGVGQDITEWKKAEEALSESKEYYNQIINRIADPVFVKDHKHCFVLVNDAMCAFTGKRREELLGSDLIERLPESMVTYLWEHEDEVLKTGRENISEDTLKDSQNNDRIVMTKKSRLIDKSGHKQIVGILRDITEYKNLETQFLQAQKMEAIGILAGGVAHDFNNLLNVINGYSELLMDDLDQDNPMREDIEQINQAGQRATTLTSQLLAFSRKQMMQAETLDLNTVISEMSSMLRRLVREDIDFLFVPNPDLKPVHADPVQIQQIIMNLVVNARDAMSTGGKLTIETANVDFDTAYIQKHPIVKKGSYVMLAISDNGIGMDRSTKAHLFEPFYTTKERSKGTGLGLAMVYGTVKQSDGFIWVYSEPGKGTTFKIYFPRKEGEASRAGADEKLPCDFQGSETILIVEDETAVRTLACRILQDRGYKVLEATDGKDALHIAQEYSGEIHMVVTDVVMPELGGTKLIASLEAERPEIKALCISGYTDNAIVHHGILDSNIAFLQKPFTIEGLSRKVREVLDS